MLIYVFMCFYMAKVCAHLESISLETFFKISKNKRDIPDNINRTYDVLYYAIDH